MHIKCQIQESEITEILLLMGATKGRDLHKSLKLFLKECEKSLWLFIDLRRSIDSESKFLRLLFVHFSK